MASKENRSLGQLVTADLVQRRCSTSSTQYYCSPKKIDLVAMRTFISVLKQVPVVGTQVASTRAIDTVATPRGLSFSGDPRPWLYTYPGAVSNIKPIADALTGIGMVSTVPEVDGVVRRYPLFVRVGEKTIYPSLPMEVLRVLVGSKSAQIKTEAAGITKVRVRGFPIVQTDAHARIWIDYSTKIPRNQEHFSGKIVIVGLTAEGLTQTVPTPFGSQDIHEVNAKTLAHHSIRHINQTLGHR